MIKWFRICSVFLPPTPPPPPTPILHSLYFAQRDGLIWFFHRTFEFFRTELCRIRRIYGVCRILFLIILQWKFQKAGFYWFCRFCRTLKIKIAMNSIPEILFFRRIQFGKNSNTIGWNKVPCKIDYCTDISLDTLLNSLLCYHKNVSASVSVSICVRVWVIRASPDFTSRQASSVLALTTLPSKEVP